MKTLMNSNGPTLAEEFHAANLAYVADFDGNKIVGQFNPRGLSPSSLEYERMLAEPGYVPKVVVPSMQRIATSRGELIWVVGMYFSEKWMWEDPCNELIRFIRPRAANYWELKIESIAKKFGLPFHKAVPGENRGTSVTCRGKWTLELQHAWWSGGSQTFWHVTLYLMEPADNSIELRQFMRHLGVL